MTGRQTKAFAERHGDDWLVRNRQDIGKKDLVSDLIRESGLKIQRVLEIGCSNGWRLKKLRDAYGCETYGIDPSPQAAAEGNIEKLNIAVGVADQLPFNESSFDLVIIGFFLCFADPEDYFRIAAESDRVLADGGYMIVHDYISPRAFRRPFESSDNLFIYFYDFMKLWTSHPGYKLVGESMDTGMNECAGLLHKDIKGAFPTVLYEGKE